MDITDILVELIGSEKQIAWAIDILTKPYNTVAKLADRYADKPRGAVYRMAAEAYVAHLHEIAPNLVKASAVISHRSEFKTTMNDLIRNASYKQPGFFIPSELLI